MITVKLYKNPYPYPYYGSTSVVGTVTSKPIAKNLRTGYIDMQIDNLNFNYLSFPLKGKTIYAWVTDIEWLAGNKLYRVQYEIDAFRTYRNDLVLGQQYIERSPTPTLKYDHLLGSEKHINDVLYKKYNIGDPTKRYAVVQARPIDYDDFSNTPVQPTPYSFYIAEYPTNQWALSQPIFILVNELIGGAETTNLVTMYSIPYVKTIGNIPLKDLPVKHAGASQPTYIEGWRMLGSIQSYANTLWNFTPLEIPEDLERIKHTIMIVIPEAGIINVPPELAQIPGIGIRQDIDIFSGACNYMLASNGGNTPYHLSVRGSSTSTIPIISDPYDTYISQNQNTLTASLMGDVANMVMGVGGNIISGNLMGAGASAIRGLLSMQGRQAMLDDAQYKGFSNPPAFLGTALAGSFHQQFWQITIKTHVNNETEVHSRMGYPYEKFDNLTLPSQGFIKTLNCSVRSSGYPVPLWAIEEINNRLDEGIYFV